MVGPKRSMDGLRVYPDGGGPFRELPAEAQRQPAPPAKTLFLRALLSRNILFVAPLLAALALAGVAGAQDADTVFDEAGVLTDAEEGRVQQALGEASARTDEPHYLFFVSDEGTPKEVPEGEGRRDFLRAEAEEVGAPDESGVVVVAPDDNWALVSPEIENAQGVFEVMRPELQDRGYAEAAMIGAERISDDATVVPEVAGFGLGAALLVAAAGGALLTRRRLRRRRELAQTRRRAEDQFGQLRGRMLDYTEKERLVSGYLEAQRALIEPGAEAEAEKHLNDAGSAGFGAEFTEASSLFTTNPEEALARIRKGNRLLDGALASLAQAENVLDRHRQAPPKARHAEEE